MLPVTEALKPVPSISQLEDAQDDEKVPWPRQKSPAGQPRSAQDKPFPVSVLRLLYPPDCNSQSLHQPLSQTPGSVDGSPSPLHTLSVSRELIKSLFSASDFPEVPAKPADLRAWGQDREEARGAPSCNVGG